MEVGKLSVQVRTGRGKGAARKMREQGLVPGVCYGVGLTDPIAIQLSPKALKAALDPVKRQNTVLTLDIEGTGGKQGVVAMLKDYQTHSRRREVLHVDLVAIDPSKSVEAEVPVEFTGKAVGSVDGGTLHVEHRSVKVACKPTAIPSEFKVDITELQIGQALHISDITFPDGVEPLEGVHLTLITCTAPREAEAAPAEEAATETPDAAAESAPAADAEKKAEKK